MESTNSHRQLKVNKLLAIIAISLIAVGIIKLVLFEVGRHNANAPITASPETTITISSDTPSEATVSSDFFMQVADDQPREIILPTIQTTGYIRRVGIDQNNQIAVPDSIYLAGWYVNSVKPDEAGLSIIDGHVLGNYNDAIFKDLHALKPGDTFSIIYGDDSEKIFRVIEIKTLPIDETIAYLMQHDTAIQKQLNLITCGGNYDSSSNQYDMRVIVKSEGI